MSASEISFSFSVTQLLGLKVCLDFTNTAQPPSLSFEARNNHGSTLGATPHGGMIKLETCYVNGRRLLRLYAVDDDANRQLDQSARIPSSPPSSADASPLLTPSSPTRSSPPIIEPNVNPECLEAFDWSFLTMNQGMHKDIPNASLFPQTNFNGFTPSLSTLESLTNDTIAPESTKDHASPLGFSPDSRSPAEYSDMSTPGFAEDMEVVQESSTSLKDGIVSNGEDKDHTNPLAPKRRRRTRKTSASLFVYNCPHPSCTRVFRSEYTCRVHSSVHAPKIRKVVCCPQPGCEETFTRKHDCLRHEVSQHGKVCEWSCSTCHRFFSSSAMLQKHKCAPYKKYAAVSTES